uniref:dTDP-4-dehydrorhamnose reductase n=1 Tax=Candidatus Kentrum sp. SD TaxID=2126332 RepID=A0A451BMR5_9GAMM|nr:MAG: dTDP-4-dehydrorhamnose reductase [Candidatus Kentron sp. SD]
MAVKYFVIGGRGYIGAELFSSIPDGVIGLRTASSDSPGFLRLRLETPQDFADLPITDGDVVFLTAAISDPDICAREHDQAWVVNVTGSSAFIASVVARGARVIFFSSDTVYGERVGEFDERSVCNPAGEYAVMKREVERRFAGNPSFKAIRLSYVFSREDKFACYITGCVQRNEEAELFHPFFRAIVHRDDVVAGALALAECWHEIPEQFINFGGPQVLSRVEFAECLREVHFHDLRFKVTEPDANFFRNRPRIIAMKSLVFAKLLGRPPRSLCEAVRLEFAKRSNIERLL